MQNELIQLYTMTSFRVISFFSPINEGTKEDDSRWELCYDPVGDEDDEYEYMHKWDSCLGSQLTELPYISPRRYKRKKQEPQTHDQ